MLTVKPISTISYNTEDYLNKILKSLLNRKIIVFWLYVVHLPEDDETRKHIHIYMEPARRLDTENLREEFKEKDLSNAASDKPLGVMPFHNSTSFQDMFLYFKHDRKYLMSMQQERKYHYNDQDIICSDKEYLIERLKTSPLPKSMKNIELLSDLAIGKRPSDILMSHNIPMQLWSQYVRSFQIVYQDCMGTARENLAATTDNGAAAKKK